MNGDKTRTATGEPFRSRLLSAMPAARLACAGAAALLAGASAGGLLWLASGLDGPAKGPKPAVVPMELAAGPGARPQANLLDRATGDGCAAGDMDECDALFFRSPVGSEYEVYGDTCGYRQPAGSGVLCSQRT